MKSTQSSKEFPNNLNNRNGSDEPQPSEPGMLSEKELDERVQKALQERPSLSIRTRLLFGFLLFFLLSAVSTLTIWFIVIRLDQRQHFLELTDRFTFEIQQARRFEKNYFLYDTNLNDWLDHLKTAEKLLASEKEELSSMTGRNNIQTLEHHFRLYKELVAEIIASARDANTGKIPKNPKIEEELRIHGAEMVSIALVFTKKERKAVDTTMRLFKRLPMVYLVVLLILTIYIANFLARQLVNPLTRLMETTERIAHGDFKPHMAVRPYKDEFTNLAIAINTMKEEIRSRQEIIAESHKMRALGTLTAGVAHELNNPLSNISTSCQILQEEVEEQISDYHMDLLTSIEGQVIKAKDIVRALLEFSRERHFELESVDIRDVVDDTLKLIKGEIPTHVELHVEIPDGIVLDLDKARMERALLNLITNGIQSMETEGVLRIAASRDEDSGEVLLTISDTGEGIPKDVLPHVFEPFFTTKDIGHGTGLGLSVVYGIIERHAGKISVESEVGKGTSFIVRLPAESGL